MHLRTNTLMTSENGAVMVISAIVMVVLLGFAALTVDLGAAWAQRRTAQSAVDAAVMAGALEYLSAPTSADVVDVVRDYVARNINDLPADSEDWVNCKDPVGQDDGFSKMKDRDGNDLECISLKQGATGDEETYLRVRLPDRVLNTAFASMIGIDTLSVSAAAEAELVFSDQAAVLPLSLPTNAASEECLVTPNDGHLAYLTGDELAVCTGPDDGNFGLLDSPFFEDHNESALKSCPKKESSNTRAPFNLAVGLDHTIQEWPTALGTIPSGNLTSLTEGKDDCDADTMPEPQVPYILNTLPGNRDLIQGLIGPGPYDDSPGRLRQIGGIGTQLHFDNGNFDLDNVGLWEYLTDPTIVSPDTDIDSRCKLEHYLGASAATGRGATTDIIECLKMYRPTVKPPPDEYTHPEFSDELLTSPRFALVPVLSYERGDYNGNEWRAIVEMKPVYLHTTWYDCGNGKNPWCWFKPVDFLDPDKYTILFNPGEGTTPPVIADTKKGYVQPTVDAKLEGLTALVLEWDWLWDGAKNQLGGNVPLTVTMHK